jgi:hypothetical protein
LKGANQAEGWDGEIFTYDEIKAPAEAQVPGEMADAKQAVNDAEQALKAASAVYSKADKALGKKPDDETTKANHAAAKTAMEATQVEVDNANTKLAALQPK